MALRLRIRELLIERNQKSEDKITATELAQRIGVSHNTILAYVEDRVIRPDLRILQKLQDFFECSAEELLENVEDALDVSES